MITPKVLKSSRLTKRMQETINTNIFTGNAVQITELKGFVIKLKTVFDVGHKELLKYYLFQKTTFDDSAYRRNVYFSKKLPHIVQKFKIHILINLRFFYQPWILIHV